MPGDDLFRSAGEGLPERVHFDWVVTIGDEGVEALDPFACGGLVSVCVELPAGLLACQVVATFPRGSPACKRTRNVRVGILEAYVGLGEQAPGPIEERISLATATSKVLVLDAPAAFV